MGAVRQQEVRELIQREVRELRQAFRAELGEAVRRRVVRCCGDLDRAVLADMVPAIEEIMAGRVMPDAFDLMSIAVAVGCRVGDLVRDVGGVG